MVQRSGPEHRAYQGALLVHGQSDWDTCTQSSRLVSHTTHSPLLLRYKRTLAEV